MSNLIHVYDHLLTMESKFNHETSRKNALNVLAAWTNLAQLVAVSKSDMSTSVAESQAFELMLYRRGHAITTKLKNAGIKNRTILCTYSGDDEIPFEGIHQYLEMTEHDAFDVYFWIKY